jgi:hypothetical protein
MNSLVCAIMGCGHCGIGHHEPRFKKLFPEFWTRLGQRDRSVPTPTPISAAELRGNGKRRLRSGTNSVSENDLFWKGWPDVYYRPTKIKMEIRGELG